MIKTDEDFEAIRAMMMYGGSFVSKLGEAALAADSENFGKLRAAFSGLFEEYLRFSAVRSKQEASGDGKD